MIGLIITALLALAVGIVGGIALSYNAAWFKMEAVLDDVVDILVKEVGEKKTADVLAKINRKVKERKKR